MKTIEIISGEQRAIFTTRSVTFDGKEFLYINMTDVSNDPDACVYTFTYDNEIKLLPYEAKDAAVLNAIFGQVMGMAAKKAAGKANGAPASKNAADTVPSSTAAETETMSTPEQPEQAAPDDTGTSEAPQTGSPGDLQSPDGQSPDRQTADGQETAPLNEKEAKKAEKERRKEEKRREKERKKAEKAAAKARKAEGNEDPAVMTASQDADVNAVSDGASPQDAAASESDEAANDTISEVVTGSEIPGTATDDGTVTSNDAGEGTEEQEKKSERFSLFKDVDDEDERAEKSAKFKKSIIIFAAVVAVIAILALIYFFVFGTSDDPSSINPSSTNSQTYDDIDELINDLQ